MSTTPRASTSFLADRLRTAYECVPEDVLDAARLHLIDAIGVGVLASATGPVRHIVGIADGGPCGAFGAPAGASAPMAALINGSLIHSLEFDDTHVASVVHGSAVIAPTVLAASQAHHASGRQLLAAFAVGWEFLIRIGLASPGRIQARGYQITSAAGAFAAAAVTGLLSGASGDVIANAIGIAGSQAGGTFAFLAAGDTAKAMQPAWAAHSGLLATAMASHGVTGPESVFDGPFGFFRLYADDPEAATRLELLCADLGEHWHLPQAAFKLVPCCHYIHPFVEAMQSLQDQGLSPETLDSLTCRIPDEVQSVIALPWAARQHPDKAHDARWSLPYVLAMQLTHGAVRASDFAGSVDPTLVRLSERMDYASWTDSGFPTRFAAHIDARLSDGSVLTAYVPDVKGNVSRPFTRQEVLAKARGNLAEAGWASDDIEALVGYVSQSQDLDPNTFWSLIS